VICFERDVSRPHRDVVSPSDPNNQEGGTDDEEFRLVAAMDRVATTWSVLNGLTMNCVQCHSHPYDPIRHTELLQVARFLSIQQTMQDRDDDFPTLRYPKKSSQLIDAAEMQQEALQLLHAVTASDREAVEKHQWKPLPIESARQTKSWHLVPRMREHEAYLLR